LRFIQSDYDFSTERALSYLSAFRGLWKIWDAIVYYTAGCGVWQSIACFVVGSFLYFGLNLLQHQFNANFKPDKSGRWFSRKQVTFFVVSRSYIFVAVVATTLLWKGAWEVLDHLDLLFSESDETLNVLVFVICATTLIGTQSFYCCLGSIIGLGYIIDINQRFVVKTQKRQFGNRSASSLGAAAFTGIFPTPTTLWAGWGGGASPPSFCY
jgi:hypothetical protein